MSITLPNDNLPNTQTDNGANHETIAALRRSIIAASPKLAHDDIHQQTWLLGTTGCHLCDVAESLMNQLAAVQPINYHYIDISDFNEPLMMHFATTIPVVLTPTQRLNYPFSVLDLQQLLV